MPFTIEHLDLEGTFRAISDSGALLGTHRVRLLPGGLAIATVPELEAPDVSIAEALAATTCSWLRAQGATVCQLFASQGERDAIAVLEDQGFRRITKVVHFEREVDADAPPPSRGLALHACESLSPTELVALMATYDGTLDCPELNGVRTPDEVLASFATVPPLWGHWYVLSREARILGLLRIEGGLEPKALDIAYLGLVLEARGQRLADELLKLANRLAIATGNATIHLTVDVRNEPALRLYRRHGFRECGQQDVYLAFWRKHLDLQGV